MVHSYRVDLLFVTLDAVGSTNIVSEEPRLCLLGAIFVILHASQHGSLSHEEHHPRNAHLLLAVSRLYTHTVLLICVPKVLVIGCERRGV